MVSWNEVEAEVDEKYGPFVLEGVPGGDVSLRNIFRLTENERHQVKELNAKLKAAKGDVDIVLKAAAEVLALVAAGDDGKRLIEALAGEAPKIMHVLNLYMEATQPGEALRSES